MVTRPSFLSAQVRSCALIRARVAGGGDLTGLNHRHAERPAPVEGRAHVRYVADDDRAIEPIEEEQPALERGESGRLAGGEAVREPEDEVDRDDERGLDLQRRTDLLVSGGCRSQVHLRRAEGVRLDVAWKRRGEKIAEVERDPELTAQTETVGHAGTDDGDVRQLRGRRARCVGSLALVARVPPRAGKRGWSVRFLIGASSGGVRRRLRP